MLLYIKEIVVDNKVIVVDNNNVYLYRVKEKCV